MFAKLYDHPVGKQVLVVLDRGDKGPEVRISTKPPGFDICDFKAGWSNDDAGRDKAEAFFRGITEESAVLWANGIINEAAAEVECRS